MNERSMKNLVGVHPALVEVVTLAASRLEGEQLMFIVTEGVRTTVRQAQLVKAGASRTMNSRHLTGHAVDLAATVDGEVRWDWALYTKLNDVMQAAAKELGIQIVWGGSWKSFADGPHWELDRQVYSA